MFIKLNHEFSEFQIYFHIIFKKIHLGLDYITFNDIFDKKIRHSVCT